MAFCLFSYDRCPCIVVLIPKTGAIFNILLPTVGNHGDEIVRDPEPSDKHWSVLWMVHELSYYPLT
jgi:hypothetical protein